jgi:hypothetical protein
MHDRERIAEVTLRQRTYSSSCFRWGLGSLISLANVVGTLVGQPVVVDVV